MRQIATALLSIGLALATLGVAGMSAEAAGKPHRYHYRHLARVAHGSLGYRDEQPPLTVNKRSWLDPGPAVPVGREEAYVTEGTFFRQTPDEKYFPSRFHDDEMPRPLYVPGGDMIPLVTFATPGAPE